MNSIFLFWLGLICVVTFMIKPSSPLWIRDGKPIFLILFLYLTNEIYSYYFQPVKLYVPPHAGSYGFYYYAKEILGCIWITLLVNIPIGLSEILWRIFYKQWDYSFIKNFRYGILSTLSIMCALGLIFPIAIFFIGYGLFFIIHWK